MLHCSWCECTDANAAVLWVFFGDNAGDKAVGKVVYGVESVHLSVDYPPKLCGVEVRRCKGCWSILRRMEKQPIVVAVTTSSGSRADHYWFARW